MGVNTKIYLIYFFSLFLNQWLMVVNSEREFNLIYSKIFILFDKTIVDVAKDGIHFFDKNLENEDTLHFINFTVPLQDKNDISKISISQFSRESGEYLLILYRRILYIFDKDHNLISNFSIDEDIGEIDDNIIYVIAYKKENKFLYFIIRYSDKNFHHILYYKFYLNSSNTENIEDIEDIEENPILSKTIADDINPKSVYCSFMAPPSTNIDHDILNCFYVSSKNYKYYMVSASYDPKRNYNEIDSLRYSKSLDFWSGNDIFFEGIANDAKDKVLFYFRQVYWYWGTFDFTNLFSDFVLVSKTYNLAYNYYGHKLLYFNDTQEFIIMSSFSDKCQKFIMVFNRNLTINYKGILEFGQACYDIGPFNIFYNGNNYTIIYEDTRWRVSDNIYTAIIIPINELGFSHLEPSIPSTISYYQETNFITDKITNIETTI